MSASLVTSRLASLIPAAVDGLYFSCKGTQCKTGHSVRKQAFHGANRARSTLCPFVFIAPWLFFFFGTFTAAEYLIHRKKISLDKISCTDNSCFAFTGLK